MVTFKQAGVEQHPRVIDQLRLGKLAVVSAALDIPALIVSAVTGNPAFAEVALFLTVANVGVTYLEARDHFVNGTPIDSTVSREFVKNL